MAKAAYKRKDEALYEAILQIRDVEECVRFFRDLCSNTELCAIEQRVEVARLLSRGEVYLEIAENTGASSATISRVNRMLNEGSHGLTDVFRRMHWIEDTNENEKEG